MPIKERVERLEERISDLDNRYYHHVMDEINEDADKKSMRIIITSMIFLWWVIWALITKLCL